MALGSTPEKPGEALSKTGSGGVSGGGRCVRPPSQREIEDHGDGVLAGMERVLGRRLAENGGQAGSQEPGDKGRAELCRRACLVSSSQEETLNTLSKRMSPTGLQFGREWIREREARLEIKKKHY